MQPGRYKIQLTNPCQESWDGMTANDAGRVCDSCSKKVIDFTSKTDDEIKGYFLERQGEQICGRFFGQQIDRIRIEIDPQLLYSGIPFWQKFLLVLLVCFGPATFGVDFVFAQTEQDSTAIQIEQVDSTLVEAALTDSIEIADSLVVAEPKSVRKKDNFVEVLTYPMIVYGGNAICAPVEEWNWDEKPWTAAILAQSEISPVERIAKAPDKGTDSVEVATTGRSSATRRQPKKPKKSDDSQQLAVLTTDIDRKRTRRS